MMNVLRRLVVAFRSTRMANILGEVFFVFILLLIACILVGAVAISFYIWHETTQPTPHRVVVVQSEQRGTQQTPSVTQVTTSGTNVQMDGLTINVSPNITVNRTTIVNPLIQVGSNHECDCATEHFAPVTIVGGNYIHRCPPAFQGTTYPSDHTITSVQIDGGDYICRCEQNHGAPVNIIGGRDVCEP